MEGYGSSFEEAFAEKYDVPIESGIVWGRHLAMVWSALNADYTLSGASPDLAARISLLLSFPDNQLMWETLPALFTTEFRVYVDGLRQ